MSDQIDLERDALDKVRKEIDRHLRKFAMRLKRRADKLIRERRGEYVDPEQEADNALLAASYEVLGGKDLRQLTGGPHGSA